MTGSSGDSSYPLPRPDDDPRFTFGLAYDVAKVLVEHGFPEVTGVDFVDLQQALFRFIYAPTNGSSEATP